jgi:hypothetical protein
MLRASWLRALSQRSLYAFPLLAVNGLFTDVAAISLSVAVGLPWSPLLHWLLLAPWACLALWLLQHRILPDAVAAWVERQEQRLSGRVRRLLRWGKPPAVLGLAATLGPLSALIGIRLLGVAAPQRYLLALEAAAAYCLVWTGLVYGGGWLLLQRLLGPWRP